jgi:hypothetical protein
VRRILGRVAVLMCLAILGLALGGVTGVRKARAATFCESDTCYLYSYCFQTWPSLTGCDMLDGGLCRTYQCNEQ